MVQCNIDFFNSNAEHDDHHHSHDHTHDPGVSSVSIVCEGNLDLEKVSVEVFCTQISLFWSYGYCVEEFSELYILIDEICCLGK